MWGGGIQTLSRASLSLTAGHAGRRPTAAVSDWLLSEPLPGARLAACDLLAVALAESDGADVNHNRDRLPLTETAAEHP